MQWEIEVSDKLGSWGAAGRIFRPGIWVTDDVRIAEAARHQTWVSVRPLDEQATNGNGVAYDTTPEPSPGPLSTSDLKTAERPSTPALPCGHEGCTNMFRSVRSRDLHRTRVHPGWIAPTAEELAVAEAETEPEPEPAEDTLESPFVEDMETE